MNDKNQEPPPTNLTWETAYPVYEKLINFLAVSVRLFCPAEGWEKTRPRRDLFRANGFHYRVEWRPWIDTTQWRRPSFYEFLKWYGINIVGETNEARRPDQARGKI
jgi:hypothetical protein